MAWLVAPAELAPGRWSLCFAADQPGLLVGWRPLCDCRAGHDSPEDAARCPMARTNATAFG